MRKHSLDPRIFQMEDYDKINGQRNHRNYSCLSKKILKQNFPEVFYDETTLYDRNMYRKYLIEDAIKTEEKALKEKEERHYDIVEIMIQLGKNHEEQSQKIAERVSQKKAEKKAANDKKLPEYLRLFETIKTKDPLPNGKQFDKTRACKECKSLCAGNPEECVSKQASNDFIATMIKKKMRGKNI